MRSTKFQESDAILFKDREEAGDHLVEKLISVRLRLINPIVFGIPRGGIPVGYCVAKRLECPFDTIVLRKLPIPGNPEAGLGAITLNKTVVLNEPLLSRLLLSKSDIDNVINMVYKEVLRRNRAYRQDKEYPSLEGRSVIVTDDGLASGYTMLAAIEFSRQRKAGEILVACPVAHRNAYNLVKNKADKVVVLHISDFPIFAVASYYSEFPEMDDQEVVAYLSKK